MRAAAWKRPVRRTILRVRSIIGRQLEHSRIFYFYNGGEENTEIASADWMGRNFSAASKTGTPVETGRAQSARNPRRPQTLALEDNQKAWLMQPDGSYIPTLRRG